MPPSRLAALGKSSDWFMPGTIANKKNKSKAFNALKMEKGEEPMELYDRVHNVAGICSSFGDVNRKLVKTLSHDYEMDQRTIYTTILYRGDILKVDNESIVAPRQPPR